MQRRAFRPKTLARSRGAWSHAVNVSGAKTLVFVAGQTALDADSAMVGVNDFAIQFDRVYENLGVALRAAGADYPALVSLRTFLARAQDVDDFVRLRDDLHRRLFPAGDYPPNTLVVVERLALPEMLIEIEAVAAL
jgi:enamine deaminase RidA (YjgF/YER057c/UK114 family)